MVTNDISQLSFLTVAFNAQQVVETLITFCGFRKVGLWYHVLEFHRKSACVDHLAFSITCMYTHTLDADLGSCGIEVLVFQIAEVASVDGISPVAGKFFNIKVVSTHSDFFVRVETYTYISVLDFIMVSEIAHSLYDFSNSCFIVCTKKCRAISYDDVLAFVGFQFRKFIDFGEDAWTQFNIFAIIVADDACLDVFSTCIWTGVHVRYKSDGRCLFLGIAFQCSVDVTHIVHLYIAKPLLFQFVF